MRHRRQASPSVVNRVRRQGAALPSRRPTHRSSRVRLVGPLVVHRRASAVISLANGCALRGPLTLNRPIRFPARPWVLMEHRRRALPVVVSRRRRQMAALPSGAPVHHSPASRRGGASRRRSQRRLGRRSITPIHLAARCSRPGCAHWSSVRSGRVLASVPWESAPRPWCQQSRLFWARCIVRCLMMKRRTQGREHAVLVDEQAGPRGLFFARQVALLPRTRRTPA